ncbi:MAG: DUF2141 domain-containing protein [Bacteroidetes bacterium]|nr:DUF2141 domain-containing protein [Bacteroidota bacterium]
MQKFILIIFLILVHMLGLGQSHELTVQVNGILEMKGNLRIAVFTNADHFKDKVNPADSAIIEVTSQELTNIFKLSKGTYAVAVYQDENNDGQLNTRALGIPEESVGFSNIEKKKLRPPDFKESAFFLQSDTTIQIPLFYDKK